MEFQPTLKHAMYNLKGAIKTVVPLGIVGIGILMLQEHEKDKAIARAFTAEQEDVWEEAKKNPDLEVTEF